MEEVSTGLLRQQRLEGKQVNLGVVYFIAADELSRVKIGRTRAETAVYGRLKAMQSGSPCELRLHREIYSPVELYVEQCLHQRYKTYRLHGEWFTLEVLREIDTLTDSEVVHLSPNSDVMFWQTEPWLP